MIRDVGNIELCELLETETKTQCTVFLSYLNISILYCTCGHFLHKERGANQQFISYTMDLLSLPEYVIKKGRPHGHRYGKKLGDKEYFTANELKKYARKNISKESMTDRPHSPFDCTRILSLYQSKWWLHSNKQGSNTMPLTQRPDFKHCLLCIDCNKKQKETHKCPLTLTEINNRHRVLPLHGGIGKVHGGLLIHQKVTTEMHQVLKERGDLLNCSIWKDSSGQDFLEINLLCHRLIVYS